MSLYLTTTVTIKWSCDTLWNTQTYERTMEIGPMLLANDRTILWSVNRSSNLYFEYTYLFVDCAPLSKSVCQCSLKLKMFKSMYLWHIHLHHYLICLCIHMTLPLENVSATVVLLSVLLNAYPPLILYWKGPTATDTPSFVLVNKCNVFHVESVFDLIRCATRLF